MAACAAGADAVYFGLKEFNARHRAANFELAELPEVMRYLHSHGVKGYLTFNTLIFPSELSAATRCLIEAARAGIDAVIVQDWGIVRLIRRILPNLSIHGSTQMSLTEARGVKLVRSWGVERVVLARELSLKEIGKIRAETDTPLEVFVHGALCVAYSGQCLTSEALGGRSANRGQCAQACRLPYEMLVDGQPKDLGDRAYLLSPQDLDARAQVGELAAMGVCSLKIEGRLKGPEYVATTVDAYKKALERAKTNLSPSLPWEETRDLQLAFSRGFSPGFLEGVNHQQLVRGRFPKARGVYVGELVGTGPSGGYCLKLSSKNPDLAAGDGIVFDLGKPQTKEPGGRIRHLKPRPPGFAEIHLETPTTPAREIPPGTPVWKTDDPRFRARVHERIHRPEPTNSATQDIRPQVHFRLSGRVGGALELSAYLDSGLTAEAIWEGPLEPANHPRTEPLDKSLGRLGDTPYRLGEVHNQLEGNLFLPTSQLNRLRREVISLLVAKSDPAQHCDGELVLSEWLTQIAAKRDKAQLTNPEGASSGNPKIALLVRNPAQVRALANLPPEERPDRIWLDMEHPRELKEVLEDPNLAELPLGVAGPRVIKPGEEGLARPALGNGLRPFLARNLGTWEMAKELGIPEIVGDFSLNVSNALAGELFFDMGLSRLTLSHDLHFAEWSRLAGELGPFRIEAVIHFPMPMFHMEHCVYAAFLSQGKDYTDCGRPCEKHRIRLKDRSGAQFPVWVDSGCRNTVYNEVSQSALDYLGAMRKLGVGWYRLECLHESPERVLGLLSVYRQVIAGKKDPRSAWKEVKADHQFGLTRGTLRLL